MEENKVRIIGTVIDESFSHISHGEKFHKITLSAARTSGTCDIMAIIVNENKLPKTICSRIIVDGSLRSRNFDDENGRHLELFVFASEISDFLEKDADENEVHVEGTICWMSDIRKTEKNIGICEFMIANNRTCGCSSYIPTIAWNENARLVSTLKVGEKIVISGRFQSREYEKLGRTFVVNELSANWIDLKEERFYEDKEVNA